MKLNRRWLVFLLPIVAVLVPLSAASTGGAASGPSGSLTVWVDAVRLPVAKLYAKTHPNVKLNIVTYDGDGNGSTTMQTKIQLWNRTGNGWPDVIFTEQANDPVWMGSPPFNFAMDLKSVFPAKLLAGWPAPSLGQCTVNGHLVCLQDNLAQEVLYVNKKLMTQFGYKVPTTWQQWAALGKKVADAASRVHHREHRRLLRCLALPVARQVPDLTGRRGEHRPDQRQRRALHADGEPARSADQERRGSARERLHRGLRPEVGRRHRQDPAHAGTGVVREGHLQRDAARAGRRVDGGAAAALGKRAARDRSGRRRSVGRLQPHEEPGGCPRLRPVGDDLAAREVKGQVPSRRATRRSARWQAYG